ncbi:MAG: hypothetical protein PHE24_01320 [Patescibacteria group bacterium]|nr:hypothetical protein [Patescibacteria group bacterium]
MKNSKLAVLALLHSLGIAVYIAIVALIMQNAEKMFGKMNDIFGPIAFLLLFVLSAAITGSLALGRPVILFLDNRKAEAIKMFLYTIGWLLVITVIVFLIKIL